jgi:hypothetical protein
VLLSGKKLTLVLLVTITLETVLSSRVRTITSASAIFKCKPEDLFFEGGKHCLQFSLNHLGCITDGSIFNQENLEKS